MNCWKTSARRLSLEPLEGRCLLAVVPDGFTETVAASNLTSPTTLDIEPGGRIWLAFQDGRIQVLENDVLLPQPAYQLDADGSGERGLQGLELDPRFEHNGHIYVYYTAAHPEPHNRLSRLTVDPTTQNTILPGSEVPLLDLPNLSQWGNPPWHIGGAIHFAPDGTLRVQVGESQQQALAQNLESPLGKVLRVNPDGSAPSDNPFYNAADGVTWRDYVWASGLRNPFGGDLDPVTGRYFIADVGAGAWEEINDATAPGRNFGWAQTEGAFNSASFPAFTQPFHAYSHAGGNCAITGGAFHTSAMGSLPEPYDGKFFFSEFCRGEIRAIDPDQPADVRVFATSAEYPMNLEFAADGSLYYIARGAGAGGAPGIGTGKVVKVQAVRDVPPQIVQSPRSRLVSVGGAATFRVSAAGSEPISFQWQRRQDGQFVDLAGAVADTLMLTDLAIADDGAEFRVRVENPYGSAFSQAALLSVTPDQPPTAFIDLPSGQALYRGGDEIVFAGGALDAEDGPLAPASLAWQVDFHHDTHSHPFVAPTTGVTGGSFVVPVVSETSANVWYRITLTATDSAGLQSTVIRDIFPAKTDFTVGTNLPGGGGHLLVDGQTVAGPRTITGVENIQRTLEAPSVQVVDGQLAFFYQWLDGVETNFRVLSTPAEDTAYVALYRSQTGGPTFLSDLPFANDPPPNGWGPLERDRSNGETGPADGNPLTLNGVVYEKGLGVHAASEVVVELGGAFGRFVSDIGVDDEMADRGSVVFEVYVDDVLKYRSPTMRGTSATRTVDVDVSGGNQLRLVVTTAGDGDGSDHANWAAARLYSAEPTPLANVNFQSAGAAVPAGHLADVGQVYGNRGGGWSYGWSTDHTDLARDRDLNADQRFDTLVHFHQGQTWEMAVPDGDYLVTVAIGDAGFPSQYTLNVEGANYWSNVALDANQFAQQAQVVTVADGRLTLDMGSAPEKATRINFVQIAAVDSENRLLPLDSGDATLDGRLDRDDLVLLLQHWGATSNDAVPLTQVRRGDFDFSGTTDAADWELLAAAWLAAHGGENLPSLDALLAARSGDFNQDAAVDGADFEQWQSGFGALGEATPLQGDAQGDGRVDGFDLLAWQRGFQPDTPAQAVAPTDAEAARTALLAGVTQIAVTGSPGRIAVFDPVDAGDGQGAFSVIHDGAYRPIAAAAYAGAGRVVAMGHNGYMNFAQVGDSLDTGRFYLNSVAWVADSTAANLRIVTPESGTASWLQARGFTNVVVRSDWENRLADADVLIAELGRSVSTAKQQAVLNFVQGGGGLITGGTGWGYQQLGADLKSMPGNVVLRNFGLGWADGFRNATTSATARSTQLGNATAALDFAEAFWTTGRGTTNQQREAGEALQAVLGVLPADHPLALDIAGAFGQRAGNLAPTPARPVSNALDKAVLTWESQQLAATLVAQVTAHPTAAALYGAIPADAPRVTQQVSVDTGQPRWQATGLYVPPGEVVTVTVPSSLVGGATRLRIGAHTDDISQRDAWERMPVVHRSFAVNQTTMQIASAFGGLLFVDLGATPPNRGTVNVTVAGAVEAPYFDLARHDDAQWNDALRDRPAPYGVLVSESLIIVLPKRQIEQADLTRPTELMTWWNQAVADQDALVGWLQPRTSPEIINVDVQISAGAAHSGFPIQAYERYWGNLADLAELQKNGSWGDFHELGHNHQRGWWTFDGDGEVSVNIFSNYNLETLARDPAGGWAWSADPVRVMQEAIGDVAVGGTYASKSDRWSFWFQLSDGFGWDAYRNVFAGYERDQAFNPGALPTNNQQEYDQWFVRWSQEVGYDMKRFMVDTWGMPVSAAAQATVAALPDWMPLATTLGDFSVPAGGSQTLDLQGSGRSMDGAPTLVGVSDPELGVLVPLGGGQYRYEPTVGSGTDRVVVSYQSSAGNVQQFTLEITIGNGFTPGDVNLDGVLDLADVDAFAAGWRSDTTGLPPEEQIAQGDLDLNGVTNLADWHVLRGAWQAAQGSALDLAVLAEALAAAEAPDSAVVDAADEDGALDAALADWGVA